MAKSIIEQLSELDADLGTRIRTLIAAHPKLAVDDRQMTDLFGIYLNEEPVTPAATASEPAAAVHTPVVPSAAVTTSTPAAVTASATTESAAILAALNGLKTSIDDRFKNVVTKEDAQKLGDTLVNNAIAHSLRQADELATIRETFRAEFPDKKWDKAAFEKFVLDSQDPVTKRNKYGTLTDAFDAMVAKDRLANEIARGVEEQVKQKTSGTSVPAQSTSTGRSAAQQLMDKEKAKASATGGSNLSSLIDRAAQLERSRTESAAVN
jgi:hypothetical protein